MKRLCAGLALLAALAAPGQAAPVARVLVVTDLGAEPGDAWALARLARAGGVELAGVVGTHAPTLTYPPAKTAAENARLLLADLGRAGVPVAAGLNHFFGDEQDIKPGPGAELIASAARGHTRERPLQVLVLGSATDVALALVVDPTLGERIQVVASAFDRWPGGGDAGNVKQDPLAWKLLLQSRAPVVVADAAVARRDLVVPAGKAQAIVAALGAAGKRLVLPGDRPLRDLGPVAYVLGQASAEDHPRPHVNPDGTLTPVTKPGAGFRWITGVNDAIWLY
jgi:inosine-uridine nucleoside N-ribohydrolase